MAARLNVDDPSKNLSTDLLIEAIERSRSPLILTDNTLDDNPIIYCNQAFLDLTGYLMKDIIGKNCRFLQGDDSNRETITGLRQAVEKGESIRVDIKNYKKDGTPFWNDLIISPIKDNNGNVSHFMGMQLDITERKESEMQLTNKTRELENSNKELEQFTYATSHDLQEPLRMISSYLQLFNKRYGDKLDADALKYLSFATEGAERMQELIYDLLTLSKVASSEDVFKPAAMNNVIEKVLSNLKQLIEEANAHIDVGKLPTQHADPVQMTQLFQNLISNAIKYSKTKAKPVIKITAETKQNEVIYSVEDNGIGIDKKYFDRIFVVFQRLHTRNEYEGTGVGLAICARIVERHKGRIWLKSNVGKGSTFYVALPLNEG